ncbi:MAG: hypothetical protein J1D77_04425, partial [Muribaculaceae bacterium]|nr:hypothetical protein [Muribaculaceae bacterium]
MKESIKLCVFILSFLFSFSVEAENKLKIKYDDGEIIEWRMSENFKPDVIITDDGPHLRLTGQHSLIFLPAVYTEWTFRDNNDLVIVQGNWYDWGYGDDYYTLEEIGNNVILG